MSLPLNGGGKGRTLITPVSSFLYFPPFIFPNLPLDIISFTSTSISFTLVFTGPNILQFTGQLDASYTIEFVLSNVSGNFCVPPEPLF